MKKSTHEVRTRLQLQPARDPRGQSTARAGTRDRRSDLVFPSRAVQVHKGGTGAVVTIWELGPNVPS